MDLKHPLWIKYCIFSVFFGLKTEYIFSLIGEYSCRCVDGLADEISRSLCSVRYRALRLSPWLHHTTLTPFHCVR